MRITTLPRVAGFLTLVWVCGCGNASTSPSSDPNAKAEPAARLVGVWEASMKPTATDDKGKPIEIQGEPVTIRFEFRPDGNLGGEFFFPLTGTWKLARAEGDKLTVDVEMNLPEGGFESKTENDKTTTKEDFKIRKEKDTLTIVFENDDEITVTSAKDPKEPLKLKQKK
jgi:hypothetical protein